MFPPSTKLTNAVSPFMCPTAKKCLRNAVSSNNTFFLFGKI